MPVRRETEAKFEEEVLVLKEDAETEKRLAELQREDPGGDSGPPGCSDRDARKQLVEAKQQVQDIAVKAIEGASGSKAFVRHSQSCYERQPDEGRQE